MLLFGHKHINVWCSWSAAVRISYLFVKTMMMNLDIQWGFEDTLANKTSVDHLCDNDSSCITEH